LTFLLIALVALLLGIAIGATGIGGVLLVPFLTLTLGIDVKRAIAAALLSYLPSCVVAVILYGRRGSIPWRDAALLCLAAVPAAWLGAKVAQGAPVRLLEPLIGALLLAGGIYALMPKRVAERAPRRLKSPVVLAIGGGTAFVSAMTGAGGAFVMLPILLLLDVALLPAIGMGQAIALPIAGVASVANIAAGVIDLGIASGLAVALTLGIAIGTPIAHALPQLLLRRLLGSTVVLAGIAMLWHSA
jgi:hypothetical protein